MFANGAVVCILWPLAALLVVSNASAGEFSGFIAAETRFFTESSGFPEQRGSVWSPSGVAQPEFRQEFNEGRDRFTAIPFLRLDANQSSRSHFDVREFNIFHQGSNWDFRFGLGKVFWGVAESRHLIDIVNQTDLVENIDEEDKLGQPMANLNFSGDFGNLSLFMLPGFRERTFIGDRDRLRFQLPVDDKHSVYESSLEQWHVDFAGRWNRTFGDWDVGVAHFWGTGREPRLVPQFPRGQGFPPDRVVPYYDIINQTSLDVQGAVGNWLFKLEAMTRGGQGQRFAAAVAGLEYTFYGVLESSVDVGVLAEYLYDGRDRSAPPTPFDHDVFVGTRLNFNDEQSTELLIGGVIDQKTQATLLNVEASRRLGDNWKIEVEGRFFENVPSSRFTDVALYGLRQDDYVQVSVAWFF
ncbi:hypothetical protein [Methylomicrobium lacus]|uniref:hypothetical protein n=1 Tax=Methylomicrobium lacus TaxID=136992 RepID=UPI0035A86B2C